MKTQLKVCGHNAANTHLVFTSGLEIQLYAILTLKRAVMLVDGDGGSGDNDGGCDGNGGGDM